MARVRRLLNTWMLSESSVLLMLSIGVGIATALAAWLFREGIDFFQRFFRESLLATVFGGLGNWGIIPVLGIAGLIVGFLAHRFIGEERHHGVAGIMEASAFGGGRLRYRRMPIKVALASFSLGAGASVGPEDPSVQIGASLGSMVGQWLHLSDDRVRLLVAAGAAGGIAAAFRAPIAGVFFALEVILGDFSTGAFGVVVLTSVISAVLTQAIEAQSIIFTASQASVPELGISNYALGGLQEIPLYIVLGILIAPVAALFIRMLYWQQDQWHHWHIPQPVKTALAGVLVGLIAVFLPQIMGTGRDTMNALLNQTGTDFDLKLLLLLVVGKMVATTISLGGGFVGGMFAPALFVGAALGRAYGVVLDSLFPNTFSANPAAFAIAGMAASMAGVIRSPITAVLLLFELTNDYRLILPIMLTTVVCLFVVERLAPDGIYHLGLARKGVRLAQGRDIDLLQTITVREAMTTNPPSVPATLPLNQLEAVFEQNNTHGLLVTDTDHHLYGIVTLQDLTRAHEPDEDNQTEASEKRTVGDICTRDLITITSEAPISEALRLIGARDLGRLPVVDANDPRQIVGLLRRRNIVHAYDLALQRKQQALEQFRNIRLATYSNARVIELRIAPESPVVNQQIRDVKWPGGSIVATIRRRRQVLVPHGDMVLQAGDILTIVTTEEQQADLQLIAGTQASVAPHL
ncbi:MAG: chloride channel protein [Chloroflexota bacterium]